MAYVVTNTDDTTTHTIYIQGNGGVRANEDSSFWFAGFSALTTIEGLEYFNTSNTTNMEGMFNGCTSLTSLDLSSFDTSKVTRMGGMFAVCKSLTSLNLSNFNTNNVTDMSGMFYKCSNLNILTLNNSYMSNTRQTVSGMFYDCNKIKTTLNVTAIVLEMNYMFNENTAILDNSLITINYTTETESIVDKIINSKDSKSNILKGTLIP